PRSMMRLSSTRPHRSRAGVVLALAVGLLVPVAAAAPAAQAATLPPGPSAPAPAPDPIDAYVPYDRQSTCDPTEKPGARYLANLAVSHYKQGRVSGITRACSSGSNSEHKE